MITGLTVGTGDNLSGTKRVQRKHHTVSYGTRLQTFRNSVHLDLRNRRNLRFEIREEGVETGNAGRAGAHPYHRGASVPI
jgi:hypothetical protein